MASYPYVDGRSQSSGVYANRADRLAALDLVTAVHRAPAPLRSSALVDYAARRDVTPLRESIELYRLQWNLNEVAGYVDLFRQPHRETADTRVAWEALTHCLDR